jgi:hypothetical protein
VILAFRPVYQRKSCCRKPAGIRQPAAGSDFRLLKTPLIQSLGATVELNDRTIQTGFFESHGYESRIAWTCARGLLKPLRRHIGYDAVFLERRHHYRFLHYEGIYAASLFGHLVVRMQTVTGARLGEVPQIAQNPECIKQLVNIGPKGATRWLLRLCPKGRRERCDYFIDEDTKNVLLEVLSYQRATLRLARTPWTSAKMSA